MAEYKFCFTCCQYKATDSTGLCVTCKNDDFDEDDRVTDDNWVMDDDDE